MPTGYSLLVRFEILKNVKRLLHCYCGFSWDLNPKQLVLPASKSLQANWQTSHSKINDYYLIKSHSRVHLIFISRVQLSISYETTVKKSGCQDSFLCIAVFIFNKIFHLSIGIIFITVIVYYLLLIVIIVIKIILSEQQIFYLNIVLVCN